MLDLINSLGSTIDSQLILAMAFLGLSTAVMAFGVPWVLPVLSFSSGMLLGGRVGVAVILAGSLIGSQLLFVVARRWMAGPIRRRWDHRLKRYDREISKRGFFYLVGLRLFGAPQLLVSTACALSPLPARTFALATLIGLTPAIVIAVTAGSVI